MKIVKKLNIPASYFYQKVIESVITDIYQQTGKSLHENQLEHFEYVKVFSKNSRAKMTIDKIQTNTAYHFRTTTVKNDFTVQYEIRAVDAHSCEVHYQETMVSHGFLQKINDELFGMVLGYFKKKHFTKMLKMIEASY